MIEILLLFLSAYFANATPVLLGNSLPLDEILHTKFFGKHKTLLGLISGFSAGVIVAFFVAPYVPLASKQEAFLLGILATMGTLVGDLTGSFVKRRLNIQEGKEFYVDNVLFIVVSMAFVFAAKPILFDAYAAFILILITFVLHRFANMFAHRIGLKKVPW